MGRSYSKIWEGLTPKKGKDWMEKMESAAQKWEWLTLPKKVMERTGSKNEIKNKKKWLSLKSGKDWPKKSEKVWLEKWEGLTWKGGKDWPKKWEGLALKIRRTALKNWEGLTQKMKWLEKWESLTLNMEGLSQNNESRESKHRKSVSKQGDHVDTSQPMYKTNDSQSYIHSLVFNFRDFRKIFDSFYKNLTLTRTWCNIMETIQVTVIVKLQ